MECPHCITGCHRVSPATIITVSGGQDKDEDSDGISDFWELSYFSDLTVVGSTTDYDTDGYSDLQESINGTDPDFQDFPGGIGWVRPELESAYIVGCITNYLGENITDADIYANVIAGGLYHYDKGCFAILTPRMQYDITVTITADGFPIVRKICNVGNGDIDLGTIVLSNTGNINGDQEIDLIDAILSLKILSGFSSENETIPVASDVDGDARININDVVYILQKAAGLRE